jgi:hypothetical protein
MVGNGRQAAVAPDTALGLLAQHLIGGLPSGGRGASVGRDVGDDGDGVPWQHAVAHQGYADRPFLVMAEARRSQFGGEPLSASAALRRLSRGAAWTSLMMNVPDRSICWTGPPGPSVKYARSAWFLSTRRRTAAITAP